MYGMRWISVLTAVGCGASAPGPVSTGRDVGELAFLAAGDVYAPTFVATAANGVALGVAGDVLGTSYPDPGCGPFCLPPLEPVVWQNGVDRRVLPALAGYVGVYPKAIDPAGNVVGLAGLPGTVTRATRWTPTPAGYVATDLGVLAGTTTSDAIGVDDSGRVVGWSTTITFPPNGSPFLWTETGGMTDLSAAGFPDETPLAISPGGMVATVNTWYDLDDPASVHQMTAPPAGFLLGSYPAVINDDGEQARFLVAVGGQNLVYPFRYHTDGTWHQISQVGTGNLTTYGLGSIDADGTVTATVLGGAVVAWGPDGVAEDLGGYLSTAYPASVTRGGPQRDGEILADLFVGASRRLVRLTPASPCVSSCLVADRVSMRAVFVEDPAFPGACFQGGAMHNVARVKVRVTDEAGNPLSGVRVYGRFLDDYWLDEPQADTTNNSGIAVFRHDGPCGTGTIAFFVDDLVSAGRTFDRTAGVAWDAEIPQ